MGIQFLKMSTQIKLPKKQPFSWGKNSHFKCSYRIAYTSIHSLYSLLKPGLDMMLIGYIFFCFSASLFRASPEIILYGYVG